MSRKKIIILLIVLVILFVFDLGAIFVILKDLPEARAEGIEVAGEVNDENTTGTTETVAEESIEVEEKTRPAEETSSVEDELPEGKVESGDEQQRSQTSTTADSEDSDSNIEPFRFAISSDSNPLDKTEPQPEIFLRILRHIKDADPGFYISAGDIIYGHTGDKEVMKQQLYDFLDAIAILDCKFFIAPGDNDIGNDKQQAYYKELINKDREFYYHFEHQGVNFIILASSGFDEDFMNEQLAWLKELLPELKEEPVFLFHHKPMYSYLYPEEDESYDELVALIREYKVDAVFSGHEHLFNKKTVDNTTYMICGCSGAFPYVPEEEGGFYCYLIVDVEKDGWTYSLFDINGEMISQEKIDYN